MSDVEVQSDQTAADEAPVVERVPAPPIESRFLYVDVAALRAKQLRRGAKSRLDPVEDEAVPASQAVGAAGPVTPRRIKAERVAMQEVRKGLVDWELPDFKAVFDTR